MLHWVLIGAGAAAVVASKKRRVLLRKGQTYRYVQRWRKIDETSFERLWAHFRAQEPEWTNLKLISRIPGGALVSYDHTVREDVEMRLPEGWFSLAFALGETDAEGRLEDARLPEV